MQEALVFWADTTHTDFNVSLPLPEVARILARACGHIGSGAEYLFHTVSKLEEFGIRDRISGACRRWWRRRSSC